MCYCCRKLEKLVILMRKCGRPSAWEVESGRPWEAVHPWLAQTDQITSQSQSESTASHTASHGLPWPPTASHFRPPKHSASHIFSCDLSEPIREPEFGLTDSGQGSAILGPVWLISRLNALLRPESDCPVCVRGRSESPKWEAVWEADWPRTHTGRCCLILGAVWLISRLNALLRPVCVRGRSASHTASHFRLSDRSHDFVVRGRARPPTASHTASQIGLSDRSDSLTAD